MKHIIRQNRRYLHLSNGFRVRAFGHLRLRPLSSLLLRLYFIKRAHQLLAPRYQLAPHFLRLLLRGGQIRLQGAALLFQLLETWPRLLLAGHDFRLGAKTEGDWLGFAGRHGRRRTGRPTLSRCSFDIPLYMSSNSFSSLTWFWLALHKVQLTSIVKTLALREIDFLGKICWLIQTLHLRGG